MATVLNGGIITRLLSEVFGFGATLAPDGSMLARTGPSIRRVTSNPDTVISDYGGSIALDPQSGVVYRNTSTGNTPGTGWAVIAGGGSPIDTLIYSPSPVQSITSASTAFTPTTTLHRFTTDANYSMTATPTISWPGAVLGQVVILMNVGATFHATINRGVGTALSLSSASPKIDPGGSMTLLYNGSVWVEIAHTQATTT